MKRMAQWLGTFGMMGVMALALCGTAIAQGSSSGGTKSGGGGNTGGGAGGGGLNRHGGNYNILWDTPQPINGKLPRAAGSVNVSTYVTTLNVDMRLISCDLPDNTPLTVTIYSNDFYTGAPWPSKVVGTMIVQTQKATLLSTTVWTSAPGLLPVIINVVVTQPDGTVVISGHP